MCVNEDRFDTSEITIMTELSRLISSRSARDPTVDLVRQQIKMSEELEAKTKELQEKEEEIKQLRKERTEFEKRHSCILDELGHLKSEFQALL